MSTGTESETTPQNSDLRLYARFDCTESARLESDQADKSFYAKVVDVGLGGVQLNSDEPLPVDLRMTLRIEQDHEIVLKVPGTVKYCSSGESGSYASGFKFSPSSHEERVEIAHFVHAIFQRQWEILAS